jgi:hypothetical protein
MRPRASRLGGSALALIALGLLAAACAGPRTVARGRLDHDTDAVTTPDRILMTGVVVDTIDAAGTLTVKDVQDHSTWTVATGRGTRIYGADGGFTDLGAIEIGDKVQIRGESRVPSIVEAEEIDIQREEPRAPAPPNILPR